MSLYDVGAGTDKRTAAQDVERMRAAADVYRQSGDKAKAAKLDAAADKAEGAAQEARLQQTTRRITKRKTGWGVSVPVGVVAAGLAVVGMGVLLNKGRR